MKRKHLGLAQSRCEVFANQNQALSFSLRPFNCEEVNYGLIYLWGWRGGWCGPCSLPGAQEKAPSTPS